MPVHNQGHEFDDDDDDEKADPTMEETFLWDRRPPPTPRRRPARRKSKRSKYEAAVPSLRVSLVRISPVHGSSGDDERLVLRRIFPYRIQLVFAQLQLRAIAQQWDM